MRPGSFEDQVCSRLALSLSSRRSAPDPWLVLLWGSLRTSEMRTVQRDEGATIESDEEGRCEEAMTSSECGSGGVGVVRVRHDLLDDDVRRGPQERLPAKSPSGKVSLASSRALKGRRREERRAWSTSRRWRAQARLRVQTAPPFQGCLGRASRHPNQASRSGRRGLPRPPPTSQLCSPDLQATASSCCAQVRRRSLLGPPHDRRRRPERC